MPAARHPATARHWLVDPICGTRNFASGIPLCCVNLALVEGGQVSVAVVVVEDSASEGAMRERAAAFAARAIRADLLAMAADVAARPA